jgi:NAD(P)-dependent dehydrogenase (short-subunit alcohol dehydrogenase family)
MRDGAVGFTRTPAGVERIGEEIYDRAGALTPQRRASVPEDVAALALWLGSPANASVTGRSSARAPAPPEPRSSP